MTLERADRLRRLYEAFNERDIETVLAAMSADVEWPNGWEGGRLEGRESVRDYWERQWRQVRPMTTLTEINERPDGAVEARVRLVVRDPAGTVLSRYDTTHVYTFDGDLVRRMTAE